MSTPEQEGCFELVMTMYSQSLRRETKMPLRVRHGQPAMEHAIKVAHAYGATVVSLAYEDGRVFSECAASTMVNRSGEIDHELQAAIMEALEALQSVPQVGKAFEQQHRDAHQRARLRLQIALDETTVFS